MGGVGSEEVCRRGRWMVVAVWMTCVVMVMGCDRENKKDPSQSDPYRITDIEINGAHEREHWAPGDEHITRWFDAALYASDRGISRRQSGMNMQVTVHHRVRIEPLRRGARLVVDVDAEARRNSVSAEAPMVTLQATAQYRHLLARGRPSDKVLHALSRTLGRQAVDDVVTQLRLRARVRQSEANQLARWIADDDVDRATRRYAIRRALIYAPENLEPTLVDVAAGDDDEMVISAARALREIDSEHAAHAMMAVAQKLSRDEDYERFLEVLPLLGKLDAPWVSIYLETVAEAHRVPRVRSRASSLAAERPPVLEER